MPKTLNDTHKYINTKKNTIIEKPTNSNLHKNSFTGDETHVPTGI